MWCNLLITDSGELFAFALTLSHARVFPCAAQRCNIPVLSYAHAPILICSLPLICALLCAPLRKILERYCTGTGTRNKVSWNQQQSVLLLVSPLQPPLPSLRCPLILKRLLFCFSHPSGLPLLDLRFITGGYSARLSNSHALRWVAC